MSVEQVTTRVDQLDDQHSTTRGDFCSFPTGHLHGPPDGSPVADDTTNAGCSKKNTRDQHQTTHRDWQQQWEQQQQEIRIHAAQLQTYGPQIQSLLRKVHDQQQEHVLWHNQVATTRRDDMCQMQDEHNLELDWTY
jgi:predicted RNase H-like nuclease (RuvC/YqgF family)